MLAYYFDLALRSFKRNRILTGLMVIAIALGIGACMTTLTVFHVLSGDPIPGASRVLFYPQLDPRPLKGYAPGDSPEVQMTRFDAETLLREKRADRQAMMSAGSVVVTPEREDEPAFNTSARFTSADFFAMFRTPFAHGNGWDASDDAQRGRVAVISKSLNDSLFGGGNSVGKSLLLNEKSFRIVGVLNEWRVTPRFYDLTTRRFGETEKVYLPFSTAMGLRMSTSGNTSCWRDPGEGASELNAPCTWVQYWVELGSAERAADYRRYLDNYADQQHQQGRFERPANTRLLDVMGWLDDQHVVPGDVRLQVWLSLGFLVACIVNTTGLLLAKFLRRSSEFAIRRALGASRTDIFAQCLVEASSIGVAGGVLGLVLAWLGLWVVRQQPTAYAKLAHLDLTMLLTTFLIAILTSLLAGALPAWQMSRSAPAFRLNEQ